MSWRIAAGAQYPNYVVLLLCLSPAASLVLHATRRTTGNNSNNSKTLGEVFRGISGLRWSSKPWCRAHSSQVGVAPYQRSRPPTAGQHSLRLWYFASAHGPLDHGTDRISDHRVGLASPAFTLLRTPIDLHI